MNIQEICDEYPEDSSFIAPEYPGDLEMSRRFMLDGPLIGLRKWKKVLENSVTEFFVLELSRVGSPGIFCSNRKKSWNFLKKYFSNSGKKWNSWNFLVPEFSYLGTFCLEIFCPGILFPGKFWHSALCAYAFWPSMAFKIQRKWWKLPWTKLSRISLVTWVK